MPSSIRERASSGDAFATVAKLPRAKIIDVRNGVDLELFRPGDLAAARAALGLVGTGIDASRRVVLGVGRLVAAKGFHVAAQALASLDDDVMLVLVGDGPDRARIEAIAPGRVRCSRGPSRPKLLSSWGDMPISRPRQATSGSCVMDICPSARS